MLNIIHTADWHLGKKLEDISRHDEQKQVLDDIVKIVDDIKPELIIIAGDIFDSVNPPAQSENLFYDTLHKLTNEDRLIVIVSGNHDNALRLSAAKNILLDQNIIFFETPYKKYELQKYKHFEIIDSYEGGIKVNFKNKNIYINTLAYPTETNLNVNFDEVEDYSKLITNILKKQNSLFQNDGYLINVSHLFIGETQTTLGGSKSVDIHDFQKVDYTALGHIHKSQVFKNYNVAYSGSILEYRSTETANKKVIIHAQLHKNNETTIDKIELKNYLPIKEVTFTSLSDLHNYIEQNIEKEYLYITLQLNTPLANTERREITKFPNVVSLSIEIKDKSNTLTYANEVLNIEDQFKKAYKESNNIEVDKDTLNLFFELLNEVENETN